MNKRFPLILSMIVIVSLMLASCVLGRRVRHISAPAVFPDHPA